MKKRLRSECGVEDCSENAFCRILSVSRSFGDRNDSQRVSLMKAKERKWKTFTIVVGTGNV